MARRFTSYSQYLEAQASQTIQIVGDITVAAKLKATSLPASDSAYWALMCGHNLETEESNTLYGVGIRNNAGTSVWSYFHESGAGVNTRVDSSVSVTAGTEYAVEIIRNTTTKTIEFVVDGVSVDTVSYSDNPTGGSLAYLRIGVPWVTSQAWPGVVRDVAIWDTKLSLADSEQYANNDFVRSISKSSLLAYWPLGGTSPENDLINNISLTIYGSPAFVSSISEGFVSPSLGNLSRQGYTTDGTYHFISDNVGLYKLNDDGTWSISTSNTSPFTSLQGAPDHIGDICVDGGVIYAGVNDYTSCSVNSDHQLVKYSASDLSYVEHQVVADTVGVSAVTTDSNGTLYLSSYCDGTQLWKYTTSLTAIGTIPLETAIPTLQGLAYKNGYIYAVNTVGVLHAVEASTGEIHWFEQLPGAHDEWEGLDFSQSELRSHYVDNGIAAVSYLSGVPVAIAPPAASKPFMGVAF